MSDLVVLRRSHCHYPAARARPSSTVLPSFVTARKLPVIASRSASLATGVSVINVIASLLP
ncbi:hypothetical protein [Bradyrhizobium yuanmingense]|uniref:hypothetical protein n=1 Tax=Bradyrhizobium yuanmingense TaxID=108015 RepID=UPI0023B926A9|nr:hypothetical protein [Bradyrhizobium yuanmingense]MDF0497959.1 hypothetical protein [Bradyrhizobium yuanmingense]